MNIKTTEIKVRSLLTEVHLLETNWTVELNVDVVKDKVLQEQIQVSTSLSVSKVFNSNSIILIFIRIT